MTDKSDISWYLRKINTRRKKYRKLQYILKEWYGREDGDIELSAYLPKPVPIQEPLNKILKGFIGKEQAGLIKLQKEWTNLIGEQCGKVSQPVSINEGCLTIEVTNSIWLMEMKTYYRPMIEKKIRKLCGYDFMKKVLFVPMGR